jgi:hypothetical protein
MTRRAAPAGRLLAVNFAACLLLLVQYLLGMAVNLYVILPSRHVTGMFLAARRPR